jgi:hypothetical protein
MVVAHKILHVVHKTKESGIVLNLDYEKAYDRVSWEFPRDILESIGFGDKWRSWIRKVLKH